MAPTGEAFRRWFGQSKVTNDSGEPLVVYHGTPDARGLFVGGEHGRDGRWAPAPGVAPGFRPSPSRGSAFFAVDRADVAQSYAKDTRAWDYQGADPAVVPLYLSIQNPLIVDGKGQSWRGTEQTVEAARRGGHDGVIILRSIDYYSNDKNAPPATVYVFFEPGQAKSALDGPLRSLFDGQPIPGAGPNVGTFDRADSDLTRNMERNPPLDRLKFIVKTYGEKQPWVVLDTISVMAPTIGIDSLRDECELLIEDLLHSKEWRKTIAARHPRGSDYGYLNSIFSTRDGQLLPALRFIMDRAAVPSGGAPIASDEALSSWVNTQPVQLAYALLLDLVEQPGFDERMREAHQADGTFPWVAAQLSKLSKAVFQSPPIYGSYLDALMLLRKRGNAIAQWAKLNRVDLGKKTLAEVLEATAQFRVSGTSVRQGRVDFEYDDGWTMQELRSKRELKDEGHVMQHCVGGYCEEVESGKSQIFSLRDADGHPHATIEWKPPEHAQSLSRERRTGHFEQIFGVQNEEVRDPRLVKRIVQWIRARFPDDVSGEFLLGIKKFTGRTLELRGGHVRRFYDGYDFESATIFIDGSAVFSQTNLANAKVYCDGTSSLLIDNTSKVMSAIFFVGNRLNFEISDAEATGARFVPMENTEQPTLLIESDGSKLDGIVIDEGIDVQSVQSRDTSWNGADLSHVDWGYRGGHRGTNITSLRSLEDIAESHGVRVDMSTMWPREREIVASGNADTISEEAFSRVMHESDDH
jgi:hypothetical protein